MAALMYASLAHARCRSTQRRPCSCSAPRASASSGARDATRDTACCKRCCQSEQLLLLLIWLGS
eukprot:1138409-Pelagomonas_calceolata.AAC.6